MGLCVFCFYAPVMILGGEMLTAAWYCVEIKKLMLALFNVINVEIIILCTICGLIKCALLLPSY